MRALLLAALLFVPPAMAEELTPQTMLDWEGEATAYSFGDWTVTVGASGPEDTRIATLRVERPGYEPLERQFESAGLGFGSLGVYPLEAGGEESLVFGAYSGGAHCCMQSITVTPVGGQFVVGDLGTYDGDGVPVDDLDGDGIFEVVLPDGRFFYTFDAYALSGAPSIIHRFKDGLPYDASREPQYTEYNENDLEQYLSGCPGEDGYYLGQCAAMLADAARLGKFDSYFAPVRAALQDGAKPASGWDDFQTCDADECKFTDFTLAVMDALRRWGYLEP